MQHNLKSNPLAMLNVLAGRTLDIRVLELKCTLQKNASGALFMKQTKKHNSLYQWFPKWG